MHISPFGIITGLIVMGFMEALWKPFTITFFKYRLFPHLGKVLQVADPLMPTNIRKKNAAELQEWLIDLVVIQTQDPTWRDNPFKRKLALKQIETKYLPSANAEHVNEESPN